MKKLPVLQTIRAAYGFAVENLGAIIGLIWLPAVVSAVLGFFAQEQYYTAFGDAIAARTPATAGPAMLAVLFAGIAKLLLYAMMIVPVTELAFGTRKGSSLVHIGFGAAEGRLFLAMLGLGVLLLVPLAMVMTLAQSSQGASGPLALGAFLAVFVLEAAVIFCALRFGFLLPAAALAGPGSVLARSWQVSAGNFWRLLGAAAGVLGPLLLAMAVVEVMLLGPSAVIPRLQSSQDTMAAQIALVRSKAPLLMGLDFLLTPFFIGLGVGASAAAWRALSGDAPRAAIAET
jgi:hypothetical protein